MNQQDKNQRHFCLSVSFTWAPSQRARGWAETKKALPSRSAGSSRLDQVTKPHWFFLSSLATMHPSSSSLESPGEMRTNNLYLEQSKSPASIPVPPGGFPSSQGAPLRDAPPTPSCATHSVTRHAQLGHIFTTSHWTIGFHVTILQITSELPTKASHGGPFPGHRKIFPLVNMCSQ